MDQEIIRRCCKVISMLLQYPDDSWREELPRIADAVDELPEGQEKQLLAGFVKRAAEEDAWSFRDRYVQTFDFGKTSNLYMTYDEHGEERERGRALIELKKLFAEEGFEMIGNELPDYLPLLLEFASAASWPASSRILKKIRASVASIHKALREKEDLYAPLLELLLHMILSEQPVDEDRMQARGSMR